MEYKIKVRSETKWGKRRYYPECEKARLFCEISRSEAGQLTAGDLENIEALGFVIEETNVVVTRGRKTTPEQRKVIAADPRSERAIAADLGLARSTVHAIKKSAKKS